MVQLKKDLDPEQVTQIRLLLQSAGMKSTTARILVLNALLKASEPITHAEIVSNSNLIGFDKSTIYRNLTDLCKANLISRFHPPGGVWEYLILSTEE